MNRSGSRQHDLIVGPTPLTSDWSFVSHYTPHRQHKGKEWDGLQQPSSLESLSETCGMEHSRYCVELRLIGQNVKSIMSVDIVVGVQQPYVESTVR